MSTSLGVVADGVVGWGYCRFIGQVGIHGNKKINSSGDIILVLLFFALLVLVQRGS